MAKKCVLCGKGSQLSVVRLKFRGKYNPTAKKRKYPNLQWVRLSSGRRVKACTKCIKTLHKK